MPAPEQFIMPTRGESSGLPDVLKAVSGAAGAQLARVFTHKVYNAKVSEELKIEHFDEYEMVGITNDDFSETVLRASCLSDPNRVFTSDLSPEQEMQLAELRERFRKQQSSSDTPVDQWEALNEGEAKQLRLLKIEFVEQIAAFKDHELYKLGSQGKSLRERAIRHITAKKGHDPEQRKAEMQLVVEENKRQAERMKELEERLLQVELEKAEAEKETAKPRSRTKPGVQDEASA